MVWPGGCHLTSGTLSLMLLGVVQGQNTTPKGLPSATSTPTQKWQEGNSSITLFGAESKDCLLSLMLLVAGSHLILTVG